MARPQKTGLDYFPFDVGLLKDKKLRRPKMKHGYLAIAVYLALLTLLYSDKGYYIPYDKPSEKEDCIWYVFDSLQGKYQPKANTIAEVIDDLVACGLFSADRYPKYITSKRAQAVYYSATIERKSVVIDEAVWLLDLDKMKSLSEKHVYYLSKATPPENGVFRPNNSDNRPNNPQSRVEERIIRNSVCKERLQAFCAKWNVQQDTTHLHSMDFDKLDVAYSASVKFLQRQSVARCLSWIDKNYASIVAGKYKDFSKTKSDNSFVTDESADRLNRAFEELNKDL